MTAPLPDAVGVVERLLRLKPIPSGPADNVYGMLRNPDGKEAAAFIQSQAARIAELEAGLKPFGEAGAAIDVVGFGAALFPSDKRAFEASWSENGIYYELTWGDFRQARSLLSEPPK